MVDANKRKIFISHASDDKALAEALSDLIEAGVGVAHDQVFCTSLAGQGIPAGTDFKGYIHKELGQSSIVIALLTPNYYASSFCLCELGGTWILSKDFLPFTTPLAGYGDLQAVLKGIQVLKIQEETDLDLDQMRDRLFELAAVPTPTPRWSVKKSKFLAQLANIFSALPKPKVRTAAEFKKVTDERDGFEAENESLENELKTLRQKYEELARHKDKATIAKVELQFSGEQEKFEFYEREVKQVMRPLSRGVREALFYWFRNQEWFPDEVWDGRLEDDIERGLLKRDSEGQVYINEEHPRIRPALDVLKKFRRFVEKASSDFYEAYEQEHKDQLDFKARGFWERHI